MICQGQQKKKANHQNLPSWVVVRSKSQFRSVFIGWICNTNKHNKRRPLATIDKNDNESRTTTNNKNNEFAKNNQQHNYPYALRSKTHPWIF